MMWRGSFVCIEYFYFEYLKNIFLITCFYLCNQSNSGLVVVPEYFLQCGISTFTRVKALNVHSATHEDLSLHVNLWPVTFALRNTV